MRKFTKAFRGVRDGEIYPTEFAAGDECPPELVAGAESLGALEDESGEEVDDNGQGGPDADDDADDAHDAGDQGDQGDGAPDEKAELQTQLDAAGIKFDKRWGVDKLRAALAEGKKD